MFDQQIAKWLIKILSNKVFDAFYGHRGRIGKRGGSVPKTEHTTKNTNSQYEAEAGTCGISISKILKYSKPHKYTAKEHKNLKDRSLIVVRGDQIAGSKFKGYQLYRYNKKDKCLESSYGDNPKLYLKDLNGKEVCTFMPTSDTINKKTKHVPRKARVKAAREEPEDTKMERLSQSVPAGSVLENEAIKQYTGSGYISFNNWLRAEGNVNVDNGELQGKHPSWNDEIKRLTRYLTKSKLEDDTLLYRNCSYQAVAGQYKRALQAAHLTMTSKNIETCLDALVGKIGQDTGFMSSSAQKDNYGSLMEIHFEIFAPKGTNATYVDDKSTCKGEKEVLGQRGLKFLCTGYKKIKVEGETVYVVQQQIIN